MKKVELIEAIATKAGLTKADAARAFDATLEVIAGNLEKGKKVPIVGFGTFEVRNRKERKGRNPSNGEEIIIPESKVPAFKPGKALKEAIAK